MFVKLVLISAILAFVNGHGHLLEPIARTSIFLRPEYGTQPPYYYNNQGVWCGNVQQDARYSTCGRCGDAPGETTANQNGIYDKRVTVATYQSGSVVDMSVEIKSPHYGHFHFELCPQEVETDNCFRSLEIVGASEEVRDGFRVCVDYNGSGAAPVPITARVRIPVGVRCSRCTIRWTYRTSYKPHGEQYGRDYCDNPHDTQTFRNCADVKIE